jgi:hypothetical protein
VGPIWKAGRHRRHEIHCHGGVRIRPTIPRPRRRVLRQGIRTPQEPPRFSPLNPPPDSTQKLRAWLDRKPAGKKPRKPLKRGGRVKPVSAKRQREGRIYSERRKVFLAANPVCMLGGPLYSAGHDPHCEVHSCEVHHVRRRGKFYLDETTWAATCASCHRFAHAHPKEARLLGLLA